MAEELELRRDEIEAEVLRRVDAAKKIMEAQMLEEMERRKQEQLEEARRREVNLVLVVPPLAESRRLQLPLGNLVDRGFLSSVLSLVIAGEILTFSFYFRHTKTSDWTFSTKLHQSR